MADREFQPQLDAHQEADADEWAFIACRIGATEAHAIADALKESKVLKQVDFRGVVISNDAASAMGRILRDNTNIYELGLFVRQATDVPEDVFVGIVDGLRHNTTMPRIYFTGYPISPRCMLAFVDAVKANHSLQYALFYDNQFTAQHAPLLRDMLQNNNGLVHLRIIDNKLGDNGYAEVAEGMCHNGTLRTFQLKNVGLQGYAVKALGKATLTMTSLTDLSLCANPLGDDGAKSIADCLTSNQMLQSIDLSSCSISAAGAGALGQALAKNSALHRLCLDYNSIEDEGIAALMEGLATNRGLRHLDVQQAEITKKGAMAVGKFLSTNQTLQSLNLSGNQIADGAKCLAEALKSNTALQKLCLVEVHLGPTSAKAFAELLAHNSTLQLLDLTDNKVAKAGATAFADVLQKNTTLRQLRLKVRLPKDDFPEPLKVTIQASLERNSVPHRGALVDELTAPLQRSIPWPAISREFEAVMSDVIFLPADILQALEDFGWCRYINGFKSPLTSTRCADLCQKLAELKAAVLMGVRPTISKDSSSPQHPRKRGRPSSD